MIETYVRLIDGRVDANTASIWQGILTFQTNITINQVRFHQYSKSPWISAGQRNCTGCRTLSRSYRSTSPELAIPSIQSQVQRILRHQFTWQACHQWRRQISTDLHSQKLHSTAIEQSMGQCSDGLFTKRTCIWSRRSAESNAVGVLGWRGRRCETCESLSINQSS